MKSNRYPFSRTFRPNQDIPALLMWAAFGWVTYRAWKNFEYEVEGWRNLRRTK